MIALLLLLAALPSPEGIALAGRFGLAHGCPVGQLVALTSAHVVDERPFDPDVPAFPMRWSDHLGNSGRVVPHPRGLSRLEDLAYLISDRAFARWYRIASHEPKPGDEVSIRGGFRWGGRGQILAERVVETRVARVVAGHLELRDGSKAGSSGSCVLNAAGELVAITMGALPVDGNLAYPAGLVVGVWGGWLDPAWREIGWSPRDGSPGPEVPR